MNLLRMNKESERFASEYNETQEILADRYEQEMNKAVSNIMYEVDKADSPYLGKDLAPIIDESLTIVDVSEGRNYYVEEST